MLPVDYLSILVYTG